MKRRVVEIDDIEYVKTMSNKEKICDYLQKNGKKSYTQILRGTKYKSSGNLTHTLITLADDGNIRKVKCECCDTTWLYEAI